MTDYKPVLKKSSLGTNYGKFKVRKDVYIYIPIINDKVISKSLNLYNPSNKIKRIYKKLINNLINISIKLILFNKKEKLELDNIYSNLFNKIDGFKYVSIYTGTPGNTQKSTIQLMDSDGEILGFCKIPLNNKKSYECIKNEYNALFKN